MPKFSYHECCLINQEEDVVKQFIESGVCISFRRKFRSWCMIDRTHPTTSKYFKSNAACRNEEVRHLVKHYYMIHPFGKFSLFWEFYMFLLMTHFYIVIPIGASVAVAGNLSQEERLWYVFSTAVLHMADVVKMFFTGYYHEEKSKVILSFSKVARRYLFSYFIFDLISCIPFFMYPILHFVPPLPPIFTVSYRIYSRLKIIRLPRCIEALELFRQYTGVSSYIFRGIRVVYVFLVVIFWAFSIYFYVQTCLWLYSGSTLKKENKYQIYENYYDACMMLLLVTITNHRLEYILEYISTLFFLFFGYALQMFLYAQILQVWIKYASADNNHHSLHKQFKEYMRYKELPVDLRKRIFTYFQFKFHKHFFKESDISNMVSTLLKQEILLHVTRNHIEKVEFFKQMPESILIKIVSHLRTEIYLPGDVIISAGTVGTTMFFIYHGTVAIYTPGGKQICILEDGAHFGEIALILNQTRVASVVAVTASELFILKRTDFLEAIEPFPELKNRLQALATDRMNKSVLKET